MWRNLAPKNWGGPNGPSVGTERVKKQNIHIQIDVKQYKSAAMTMRSRDIHVKQKDFKKEIYDFF